MKRAGAKHGEKYRGRPYLPVKQELQGADPNRGRRVAIHAEIPNDIEVGEGAEGH